MSNVKSTVDTAIESNTPATDNTALQASMLIPDDISVEAMAANKLYYMELATIDLLSAAAATGGKPEQIANVERMRADLHESMKQGFAARFKAHNKAAGYGRNLSDKASK